MLVVLVLSAVYFTAIYLAGRWDGKPGKSGLLFAAWPLAFGLGFLSPLLWGAVLFGLLSYSLISAVRALRRRQRYLTRIGAAEGPRGWRNHNHNEQGETHAV